MCNALPHDLTPSNFLSTWHTCIAYVQAKYPYTENKNKYVLIGSLILKIIWGARGVVLWNSAPMEGTGFFRELVLPFYYVGSGDQTQVAGFSDKQFCLLSYLVAFLEDLSLVPSTHSYSCC